MILSFDITTEVVIDSLSDLFKLKKLMEVNGKLKINKTKLAKEFNVDRRTIDKYLNGYVKKTTRKRSKKLDIYYDEVKELLGSETQVFFYKRVLCQYLMDKHNVEIPFSSFRKWISSYDEFQAYFNGTSNRTVNGVKRDCTTTHHVLHMQTGPAEEAQIDYKESMVFTLKDGSLIEINVLSMVFSYSRFKIFQLAMSKSQVSLFHLLDRAFEIAGGVPKSIRTDNMKTVMDVARTSYNKGVVNAKFSQFAKDYGFKVVPCKAGEPMVKAKVESPMKVLDELYAYNGKVDIAGLAELIKNINERENNKVHPETCHIPSLLLKKEKDSLLPIPSEKIRNPYKIKTITVKVSPQSLITYKQKYYSVPTQYIGKNLVIQIIDQYMHVYDNTKLITIHELNSNVKRNYHREHLVELESLSLGTNKTDITNISKNNLKEAGNIYE